MRDVFICKAERDQQKYPVWWFTSPMSAVTKAGPDGSQGLGAQCGSCVHAVVMQALEPSPAAPTECTSVGSCNGAQCQEPACGQQLVAGGQGCSFLIVTSCST